VVAIVDQSVLASSLLFMVCKYTNATKILHLIDKKSLKKMTDYDSVPPRLMRDEENIRGKAYGHTPKTYLV
jgi:hypothetical protein